MRNSAQIFGRGEDGPQRTQRQAARRRDAVGQRGMDDCPRRSWRSRAISPSRKAGPRDDRPGRARVSNRDLALDLSSGGLRVVNGERANAPAGESHGGSRLYCDAARGKRCDRRFVSRLSGLRHHCRRHALGDRARRASAWAACRGHDRGRRGAARTAIRRASDCRRGGLAQGCGPRSRRGRSSRAKRCGSTSRSTKPCSSRIDKAAASAGQTRSGILASAARERIGEEPFAFTSIEDLLARFTTEVETMRTSE